MPQDRPRAAFVPRVVILPIALAFAALAVLVPTRPASGAGAGIRLGAEAGLNLSRAPYVFGSDTPSDIADRTEPGARGGVTLSLFPDSDDALNLGTGLFLERRGGTTEVPVRTEFSDSTLATSDVEWRFLCLSAPVAVTYRLGRGATRPYVKAGAEAVFPLAAEREAVSPIGGANNVTVTEMKDQVTTVNFGLLGGLGVEFPLASVTGILEASYRHGIGDFLDVDGASVDVQLRHRVFNVTAGLRF